MPNPEMRNRVERLLNGDFRVDDLTRLFLYARDRCDGRQAVREVGDFVAHRDERTKGTVTRTARDFFSIVRFIAPRFDPDQRNRRKVLDLQRLPSCTPDFLRATLRGLDNSYLRREAGMTLTRAKKELAKIIVGLIRNPDGTHTLRQYDQYQAKLFECLCSVMVVRPAFSDVMLFRELQATLKSQALLTRRELVLFERLRPAISLFAVSVMHQCDVIMEDGSTIALQATKADQGRVGVLAAVPAYRIGERNEVSLAFSIFQSDLDARMYCQTRLRETPDWDFAIEVTPDMQLAAIA